MKNIHIIPTDKPSRLCFNNNIMVKKYQICDTPKLSTTLKPNFNIYITSDEYIGLSYYLDGKLIRKGVVDDKDYWEVRKDYKKIILTTDQELINDGVQSIDDEFLQWFVDKTNYSGVHIDIVKVETYQYKGENDLEYKIIIPKDETEHLLSTEANRNRLLCKDCNKLLEECTCIKDTVDWVLPKKNKLDCSKITTLEEVKLILESLDLHMSEDCPNYDKLKHLLYEK